MRGHITDVAILELVQAQVKHGTTPSEVAKMLDGKVSYEDTVRLCQNARRILLRRGLRQGTTVNHTITIPARVHEALEVHALERDIPLSTLIARLLRESADMVDAILDDRRPEALRSSKAAAQPATQGQPEEPPEPRYAKACQKHLEDLQGSGLGGWPNKKLKGKPASVVRSYRSTPHASFAGSPSAMCAEQTA